VVLVLIALEEAVITIAMELTLTAAVLPAQIVMLMINVIMNITGIIIAAEQAAHIFPCWILNAQVLLLMLLL